MDSKKPTSIKLKSLSFDSIGFRKLRNCVIDIAPRVTIVAGHNGIGKSSILGLIANGSTMAAKESGRSLFGKGFLADFSEIFYLDYYGDFKNCSESPSATLIYKIDDTDELIKLCKIQGNQKVKLGQNQRPKKFMAVVPKEELEKGRKSKSLVIESGQQHTLLDDSEELNDFEVEKIKEKSPNENATYIYRLRVIPRTTAESKAVGNQYNIGDAAKIPIPTLYIGMSRMAPIGEFDWEDINQDAASLDAEDVEYIYGLFHQILPFESGKKEVFSHAFARSTKRSQVPNLGHSSLTISLGQDSLSAIVTAFASFSKLKKKLGKTYIGGILVIDEVDAGLHPKAQEKLAQLMISQSRDLNLQIVATSHSLTIIKTILENHKSDERYRQDKVVYLMDSNNPRLMSDVTYTKIKNDMLVSRFEVEETDPIAELVVYFEDDEAFDLMKAILNAKKIVDTYDKFGVELKMVPAKLGCDVLFTLAKTSDHFKNSLIILDNDFIDDAEISMPHRNKKRRLSDFDNVRVLPGSISLSSGELINNLSPERLLLAFLIEKRTNLQDNTDFWSKVPDFLTTNYTDDHLLKVKINSKQEPVNMENVRKINREVLKKWYIDNKDAIHSARLFELWAEEYSSESDQFITGLTTAVDAISKLAKGSKS